MEREERNGVLEIHVPWGNPLQGMGIMLFGVLSLAVPTAIGLASLTSGDLVGLCALFFLLPGLGVMYGGAVLYVNITTIAASPAGVATSFGPLPWFGVNTVIRRADITALSVDRTAWIDGNGREHESWTVAVYLRDGSTDELLSGFKDRAEVEEACQELRAFLEIQRALETPEPQEAETAWPS